MMSNKLLLNEIADLVWGYEWQNAIDPAALLDRIKELLRKEQQFTLMQKRLRAVKEFLGILSPTKEEL